MLEQSLEVGIGLCMTLPYEDSLFILGIYRTTHFFFHIVILKFKLISGTENHS